MADSPTTQLDTSEQPTPESIEQQLIADIARVLGVSKHTGEMKKVRRLVATAVQANTEQLLERVRTDSPQKLPRVTRREGYYLPYQPQVEQHRRTGWNEAIDQFNQLLDSISKEDTAV